MAACIGPRQAQVQKNVVHEGGGILQTAEAKVMHMRIIHMCICKLQQRIRAGQLLEGSLSSQHGSVSHAGHCSRKHGVPLVPAWGPWSEAACVTQSGRGVANAQLHCISRHHHLQAPEEPYEGWHDLHSMIGSHMTPGLDEP